MTHLMAAMSYYWGYTEKESRAFLQWAFGDGWEKMSSADVPDRWNARHGDKLAVKGSDPRTTSLTAMIHLWRLARHEG